MVHISCSCLTRVPKHALRNCQSLNISTHYLGAEIAQSVELVAMGWTFRRSNRGEGQNFPLPSRQALRPNQPPVPGVPGPFPRAKGPGQGVDHPPSAKYSYTSTNPLSLHGLFYGGIYLKTLINYDIACRVDVCKFEQEQSIQYTDEAMG